MRRRTSSRGITGEFDDVERVHDFDSLGQFLNGGCFEAGESAHRDDIDAITLVFRSGVQPLFEHLFRPSGHHVEQACRPVSWLMGSQVDDDGDILVTAPWCAARRVRRHQ
ncbi:hypothetical protein CHUV2995_02366 [Corynebacterium diphtheriae subsp. lausannense]|nr:hypothetical protein CHUV2995_02366 [Corynebacterium diphtheriae subsp. lausannense]